MWSTFLRIYQLLQKLMPQRVIYDPKKGRFVEYHKFSTLYWFVNFQGAQACVVAAVRMSIYLQSEPGKSEISFLDFVADLLLWGLTFLHALCCWSFHYKRHYFCFVLNQYLTQADLKDEKLDLVTVMLCSLLGACVIFPAALGVLPFFFTNTTIHSLARFYLPNFLLEPSVGELTFAVCWYLFHGFYGGVDVIFTLTSVLVVMYVGGNSLKPTIPRKLKSSQNELVVSPTFPQATKIYKKAYLIWDSFLHFGSVLLPGLILSAFLINVVTTFSCLKLYKQLPAAVVFVLFMVDMLVLANTFVFHAFSMVVCYDFEKFYQSWKGKLKGKRSRMILKSCFPTRAKVG